VLGIWYCHKAVILILCARPEGVRSHDRAWPCWALAFFGDKRTRRNMEDANGKVWLIHVDIIAELRRQKRDRKITFGLMRRLITVTLYSPAALVFWIPPCLKPARCAQQPRLGKFKPYPEMTRPLSWMRSRDAAVPARGLARYDYVCRSVRT
jgi:hypothetical protein